MLELSQETIRAVNLVMLIFCSVEAVIVLFNSPPNEDTAVTMTTRPEKKEAVLQ